MSYFICIFSIRFFLFNFRDFEFFWIRKGQISNLPILVKSCKNARNIQEWYLNKNDGWYVICIYILMFVDLRSIFICSFVPCSIHRSSSFFISCIFISKNLKVKKLLNSYICTVFTFMSLLLWNKVSFGIFWHFIIEFSLYNL